MIDSKGECTSDFNSYRGQSTEGAPAVRHEGVAASEAVEVGDVLHWSPSYLLLFDQNDNNSMSSCCQQESFRCSCPDIAGVRGMAATEAVKRGDMLVSLPRSAALLAAPGQQCPFPEWVHPAFWDGKPWCVRSWLSVPDRSWLSVYKSKGRI